MKKEGSRLSLQRYVQSKACRHALDSNRQGEASAALKIIPSLGLMEVSFPQNEGSLLAAQRGYQGGLQLALLCVPGGGLMFSSTLEPLALKENTQMLIIASLIFF